MQHDLRAGDGRAHRLDVPELAEHDIDLRDDVGLQPIERSPLVAGVVPREGAHRGALADEPLYEVTADEATRAGHEHGTALKGFHPAEHMVRPLRLRAWPRGPCRSPTWSCPSRTSRW